MLITTGANKLGDLTIKNPKAATDYNELLSDKNLKSSLTKLTSNIKGGNLALGKSAMIMFEKLSKNDNDPIINERFHDFENSYTFKVMEIIMNENISEEIKLERLGELK